LEATLDRMKYDNLLRILLKNRIFY